MYTVTLMNVSTNMRVSNNISRYRENSDQKILTQKWLRKFTMRSKKWNEKENMENKYLYKILKY